MSIESVRDYWDARPCNTRHSAREIGTKEYFDEVEERKYFVEPHIPRFADFGKWSGKQVLEIGCGIGTDAVSFARAGSIYTGIELSPESAGVAASRLALFDLPGEVHVGNAEEIDQILDPSLSFDLIYSFGVLHHTPDPALALRKIRRFLKPDGELRIMLYARNSWKSAMIRAGLDQPEAQAGCPIAFEYSKDEAQTLLHECGYECVDIQQTHIFPYSVPAYIDYRYEKLPWFEAMPDQIFQALETAFGWHLLIRGQSVHA